METLYIILIVFFVVIALISVGAFVFVKYKDGAFKKGADEKRVSGGLLGSRSSSDEDEYTLKRLRERIPKDAIDTTEAYIYVPEATRLVYAPVILIKLKEKMGNQWYYLGNVRDEWQPLFLNVDNYKNDISRLTEDSKELATKQWKKIHKEFIKPKYTTNMAFLDKFWYKGDGKALKKFYDTIDDISPPGKPGSYQKAVYLNTSKVENELTRVFNGLILRESSKRNLEEFQNKS